MSVRYTIMTINKDYDLNPDNIEKNACNKYDLDFININLNLSREISTSFDGFGYYELTKDDIVNIIDDYKKKLIQLNLDYHRRAMNNELSRDDLILMFAMRVSIYNSPNFLNLSEEIDLCSSILTEHLIFNLINFYKRVSINDLIILKID